MKTAEEILRTLTLEEKASLCQGDTFWTTKAIPEKDVPEIMMTDGPHGLRKQTGETDHLGVNKSVPATCFPSAAAMACSWDRELIQRVGEALGEECLREGVSILLGPGANIKRSPLCGRNFEYFSEDPYLSSQMAKHHILGVQSKGVGTSLKHFAVNNQETCRMSVNEIVDERTLREIYLASFEAAVKEARPWTIMSAYNRVNGEFCSENHHLIHEILRGEWGYEGVVVSDWGAANDQAKGIREGFDLRMPYSGEAMKERIIQAVKDGRLPEEKLDETVRRLLSLILEGAKNRREDAACDMEAHHLLARQAAEESAVLLKNDQHVLPAGKREKIAIVGAFAKYVRYQGGGSSHVVATKHRSVLQVLDEDYPDVKYSYTRGYRLKRDRIDEEYKAEAVVTAAQADRVVVFAGLPDGLESEGFDRRDMRLPDNQNDLIETLIKLNKPMTVVLFAGSPVEMDWADRVPSILCMYTGGQAVAEAAVRLLLGDANPCGKLAETYPLLGEHAPCALTYPQHEEAVYSEGVFVGYRYYEKKRLPVRYAFGHGLSYTTFAYANLKLDRGEMTDQDTLTVSFDVTNTGTLPGREIAQLYVRDVESGVPRPVKELRNFVKVSLRPGETRHIEMKLGKRAFAYYHVGLGDWYAEDGEYEILVGAASDDIRLRASVTMRGSVQPQKKYNEYVTMGELARLPGARPFLSAMNTSATPAPAMTEAEKEAYLEDEDDMREVAMDLTAMSVYMPLIKVADMTAGAFPYELVEQIVKAINE
ncbi:MAG: glycoside hydrolase family 3 C-terminal domain-containing protein [Clostridia bacterium]|nr:glycoside hydrolase family 3 C-terminal domain-containing protein [Clostridia bacterium]